MYGNSNYLMHYGTPNMRWYHVGEGKRQENPNKYAHKDQTIGFDDSKWKNSRAYQKLHGIKESLYLKADEAQAKADEAKQNRDVYKDSNKKLKRIIKFEEDHSPLFGKKSHEEKLFRYRSEYENTKSRIKDLNKEYGKNKRSAFLNRTLGRLMNIPLAVAFIGYSAGSNLASAAKSIGRTIGSIKIGKKTIGEYAKKFAGLFRKKTDQQTANKKISNSKIYANGQNSKSSKSEDYKYYYNNPGKTPSGRLLDSLLDPLHDLIKSDKKTYEYVLDALNSSINPTKQKNKQSW